ncbi:hypothetical protein EVG20_g1236 [Dentipellis fragilis]|uniref:Uncharacterized protein n=1 Tax=Dentipellis fragilis TaxID=205917 RepID=A0A4Y9ZDD6_9AGAM|nr:hypothetical protein EVG20_g1236 [Dentipellis fragilis]
MSFSRLEAEIWALFLEAVLYGVLLSLYCSLLLVMWKKKPSARAVVASVATVLLTLATVHISIDVARVLRAFVFTPQGALVYYDTIHPLYIAKIALYVTQMLLGDGVIVWRCYIIFDKRWKAVILPVAALLVNAGSGYYVCYAFSQTGPTMFTHLHVTERLITTFFSLTMSINVSSTVAIALRIFIKGSRSLWPVLFVVVETGALYSTALLGLFIAYLTNLNGQFPALNVVQPLVGIVFILISLQIHYHFGSPTASANSQSLASIPRYPWTPQGSLTQTKDALHLHPMHSLAVQVSEETAVDFTHPEGKKSVGETLV